MKKIIEVADHHKSELGEGPIWDHLNDRILWIDILNGEIHQLDTFSLEKKIYYLGGYVGAISLCSSGELLVALQNNFGFIRENQGIIEICLLPSIEEKNTDVRFNDAKCDSTGNFWAGTMDIKGKKNGGQLLMLDKALNLTVKIPKVGISNGMAWSSDKTTFYFIDTAKRNVVAYDHDPTTTFIGNPREIIQIPQEMGKPDGMTIDEEGMLWIALWKGGKITRWDPKKGKCNLIIQLPVSQVTSCTFGGKNLEDLYITSAKVGLSPTELQSEPLAGALFVIKNLGIKGTPASLFNREVQTPNYWLPL